MTSSLVSCVYISMQTEQGRTLPYIIAVVVSAVSTGMIGTIAAYSRLDAETVTFFRLFFGCLMLFLFLLIAGKVRLLKHRPPRPVILSGVMLAVFMVTYIKAMSYTSMANAIFTIYLAPVAASIFAHFFFSEKLSRLSLLLILCALSGFAMIREFKLDFSSGRGADELKGLLLALTAMIFYAGFILFNRKISDEVHVFTRSWYQLFIGAMCTLPFMIQNKPAITLPQWGWLLAAGFVPGFLGIMLAVVALKKLSSATFGTLAYLEPITVTILGWGLFGENLNALQIAGCAVVISAGILRAITPLPADKKLKPVF